MSLNMTESSNHPPAPSSNLESLILRRVAGVKNEVIAQAIGNDHTQVTYIMKGERGIRLHQLESFFLSLGLRVIECDGPLASIPAEELAAVKVLAGKYFK
jgi:hypothetical protein